MESSEWRSLPGGGCLCVCVCDALLIYVYQHYVRVYVSGISLTATCKIQDVANAKFYIYRSRFNPAK